MTAERQEPDTLIDSTNYGSPVVGDIQADPDSKTWIVADPMRCTSNNVNPNIHCSFPTPTDTLTSGADLQNFRVQTREFDSGQTGTATIRIELWEDEGTPALVRAGSETDITGASSSTTGQVVELTWNSTEVTTDSGANVQIKVFCTKSGGGAGQRQVGDIGAVEWNVDYTASGAGTEILSAGIGNPGRTIGPARAARLGGELQ